MRNSPMTANPFVMMIQPEAILRAVEHSDRLNRLQRRICRPLDRPLIPKRLGADVEAFDSEVDSEEVTA